MSEYLGSDDMTLEELEEALRKEAEYCETLTEWPSPDDTDWHFER